MYSDGVLQDLNGFLAPNSGWDLWEALAINNHGQIAGLGYDGDPTGLGHVFLMTPTPEPSTWTILAIGFGGLGAVLRSRPGRAVTAS